MLASATCSTCFLKRVILSCLGYSRKTSRTSYFCADPIGFLSILCTSSATCYYDSLQVDQGAAFLGGGPVLWLVISSTFARAHTFAHTHMCKYTRMSTTSLCWHAVVESGAGHVGIIGTHIRTRTRARTLARIHRCAHMRT